MARINKKEYEYLKSLDNRWNWIARDGVNNRLYAYLGKPNKYTKHWKDEGLMFEQIDENLFQFIQWEDEEPYNIADLIDEYESSLIKATPWTPYPLDFESEETEVKDKIWLKDSITKEIQDLFSTTNPNYFDFEYTNKKIRGLVNQLDEPEITLDKAFEKVAESYPMTKEEIWRHLERLVAHGGRVAYGEPEVLSQEWIDKHTEHHEYIGYTGVPVKDLQNLLVPTLSKKVQLSQKTADELNRYKERGYSLKDLLVVAGSKQAQEKLARAWLDGYTVEEPKYRARLKVITDEFIASYLRTQSSDAEYRLKVLEIGSKYIHEDYRHLSEFTEDELKSLDIWDSDQWEIEELEE